jgi:hypothetical protein
MSFGALLGALAIKLVVVDDEEMLAAIGDRIKPRSPRGGGPHADASMRPRKRHRGRPFKADPAEQQFMLARRLLATTPAQRSRWAKRAARIRWGKPRGVKGGEIVNGGFRWSTGGSDTRSFARIERNGWTVSIHPADIESPRKVVTGPREKAERIARSMIDRWHEARRKAARSGEL